MAGGTGMAHVAGGTGMAHVAGGTAGAGRAVGPSSGLGFSRRMARTHARAGSARKLINTWASAARVAGRVDHVGDSRVHLLCGILHHGISWVSKGVRTTLKLDILYKNSEYPAKRP
jgi:hypothetical protein